MASLAPFTPAIAPRVSNWTPSWWSLFGERRRNTAYGWPEPAFDELYRRIKLIGRTIHLINDPEMIDHILLKNHANYVKPTFMRLVLGPIITRGLLLAEHEDWQRQRKIVAPAFTPTAIAKLNAAITEVATHQIARWPNAPEQIDMAEAANEATVAVISKALFSGDPRLTSPDASASIRDALAGIGKAPFTVLLGLPEFSFRPSFWRGLRGRRYLRRTLTTLVDERGPGGGGDDFFGGLIRSLYAQFPADEARRIAVDNALTFYLAGHETTAAALAWTSYLLAAQPALQDEARAEAVAALAGDPASLPDRLPLLRQIIEESMRLYPPVHRIERQAVAEDRIGDVAIKKGDIISIWPLLIHRHRALWKNPDAFDHRRFTPEAKAKQHRFQYLPFGAGPRICVGARLALVEALIILAHWLAARRFEAVVDHPIDPVGGITLRPRDGMPLLVTPL